MYDPTETTYRFLTNLEIISDNYENAICQDSLLSLKNMYSQTNFVPVEDREKILNFAERFLYNEYLEYFESTKTKLTNQFINYIVINRVHIENVIAQPSQFDFLNFLEDWKKRDKKRSIVYNARYSLENLLKDILRMFEFNQLKDFYLQQLLLIKSDFDVYYILNKLKSIYLEMRKLPKEDIGNIIYFSLLYFDNFGNSFNTLNTYDKNKKIKLDVLLFFCPELNLKEYLSKWKNLKILNFLDRLKITKKNESDKDRESRLKWQNKDEELEYLL